MLQQYKSCYDRVVYSVGCLACQRLGISAPLSQSVLTTIQNLKNQICANYGDSSFYISSDMSLYTLQGILQYIGTAPITWVVISATSIEYCI